MSNVPGPGPVLLPSEAELKANEDRIEAAIRYVVGGHAEGDWKDDAIEEIMQQITAYVGLCVDREVGHALNATAAARNAEGRAAWWEAEAKRLETECAELRRSSHSAKEGRSNG